MAYRVGIQCVSTQTEADDLILSTMPPTITADGQLIRPVRKDDGWYLNQHKIELTHPQCDIMQQIQNGAQMGSMLVMIAVFIFGFKAAINLIKSMNAVGASDDN
ncbi:hypothetical protein ACKLNO_01230 [Neisseriaceae bacterium B1]